MPFVLTNCATGEVLYTNSELEDSIGLVVNIDQQEGCWLVEEQPQAITVTITETYATCKGCLPIDCYTKDCR